MRNDSSPWMEPWGTPHELFKKGNHNISTNSSPLQHNFKLYNCHLVNCHDSLFQMFLIFLTLQLNSNGQLETKHLYTLISISQDKYTSILLNTARYIR